jgi:uncharacterized membrane protein YphA (DoxX/SURF4 family)
MIRAAVSAEICGAAFLLLGGTARFAAVPLGTLFELARRADSGEALLARGEA